MGASFDSDLIKDKELKLSDKEIEVEADRLFEQAAYNYGHAGYTGTLAEKIDKGVETHRDKPCEDVESAREFIMDKLDNDKWGQADVIPVKGIGWVVGGWCSE